LIGDQGVGKSSVLLRYTQNDFKRDYGATIGIEFASKSVEIDPETIIKLQIWDTAGQESFRSIVRSFYRSSTAAFLVYQVNKKESFESLQSWLEEIRDNASENIVIVLMGNQCDLEQQRQVTYEEGEKFMKDNDLHFFFETSAANGNNVDKAFNEAAKLIFLRYIGEMAKQNEVIPVSAASRVLSSIDPLPKSPMQQKKRDVVDNNPD